MLFVVLSDSPFMLWLFIFYADNQTDIISSQVKDSVDTNLRSPRNCQPANSDNDSAFRTPTAKLRPTKKAIQGKYIQLILGVVCSLTKPHIIMLFPKFGLYMYLYLSVTHVYTPTWSSTALHNWHTSQ